MTIEYVIIYKNIHIKFKNFVLFRDTNIWEKAIKRSKRIKDTFYKREDSKENKEWTSERTSVKVTFFLPNWVVHG